jgi:hypothetical protein
MNRASRPPSPYQQTAKAQQRRRHKGLMRNTAASCLPSTNKAAASCFPIEERWTPTRAGQGGTRASPAQRHTADALRLPVPPDTRRRAVSCWRADVYSAGPCSVYAPRPHPDVLPTWLAATQEKPGGRGRGVEILVRGPHFAGQRRICRTRSGRMQREIIRVEPIASSTYSRPNGKWMCTITD